MSQWIILSLYYHQGMLTSTVTLLAAQRCPSNTYQYHIDMSMISISYLLYSDMGVVLEVLNVLYVFSKRSNFFTRLATEKKKEVIVRLKYLAEVFSHNPHPIYSHCLSE